MTRSDRLRLEGWAICLAMVIVTTPGWLFVARLWWEWTHALLTKPWSEIFCMGSQCLR